MARLASLAQGDARLTMRLAQMVALREGTGSAEAASWALGRLIGMMAALQPVVLVIDNLHWAVAELLDTLEQVVHRADSAPVLVICMSREAPRWSSLRSNIWSFTLTPLQKDHIGKLITNFLEEGELDAALRQRLAEAALGYPLYAEEYVAMLQDGKLLCLKDYQWVLTTELEELPTPSSVEMLLAARLEELSPEERTVVRAAAVIGPRFRTAAVATLVAPSLAGGDQPLHAALQSLVQRGQIQADPDSAAVAETGGLYRFRHQLKREIAYRTLAKRARAELHERYADWLAQASNGTPR
jgi:predicted ATPase